MPYDNTIILNLSFGNTFYCQNAIFFDFIAYGLYHILRKGFYHGVWRKTKKIENL
ncbi:predicted protein [Enterococcus faecium 1,141,733]|nr:predicted protein [Enterococcus faecium 1,141,733]